MKIGHVHLSRAGYSPDNDCVTQWILHFPTKNDWCKLSKLEYIAEGLVDLALLIRSRGLASVALPALGCGLGGLDRGQVFELITGVLRPGLSWCWCLRSRSHPGNRG